MRGAYQEIHTYNRANTEWYTDKVFSFVRYTEGEQLIIITNFSDTDTYGFDLRIPHSVIEEWGLTENVYTLTDLLYGEDTTELFVHDATGKMKIELDPLESYIFSVNKR